MIDVAYILSHGFAARMVMQTDLLGKLKRNGLRIAVIVPDARDSRILHYCNDQKIELYEFNPQSGFWSNYYFTSRKYFLEDIEKNPALLEKHIWDTKYNKTKNPLGIVRPRALYLLYKITKLFPIIKKWYRNREEKYLDSTEAKELIKKLNPKLLISTYPVNLAESLLLFAGNKKSECTTIIHLLSWDNISCKGHFPALADEYIAWGPIMQQEFKDYYNISEKKIHVCGVPHFDLHIESKDHPGHEKYLRQLGLNPKYDYIFFAMSSPRFAPHEIDIVEHLSHQIANNEFGENMQLIVRPHPQNIQGNMADLTWIPRLRKLETKNVKVDFPDIITDSNMTLSMGKDDMIRLSQLLSGAKICINSGSTVSIDALVCGVPVILTSFDAQYNLEYWKSARRLIDFNHLSKMVKTEGVSVVHDFDSLQHEIRLYISDNNRKMDERKKLLIQECSDQSGNATNNVMQLLTSMVEKHNQANVGCKK